MVENLPQRPQTAPPIIVMYRIPGIGIGIPTPWSALSPKGHRPRRQSFVMYRVPGIGAAVPLRPNPQHITIVFCVK